MSRHTRANPSGSGDAPPPPPDPNMAQLLRLLMEERQAARDERQANMAALQQLVQAATNANQGGGGAGGNEEPRSRLRAFQNSTPRCFPRRRSLWRLRIGSAPWRTISLSPLLATTSRSCMPPTTSPAPQGAGGKECVPVFLKGKY